MSRTISRTRNIVAALWMGNASGRDIHAGIYRYAKRAKFWQTTLLVLPSGFSKSVFNQILAQGADGIITTDPDNPDIRQLADTLAAPLVIIDRQRDIPRAHGGPVIFVDRDDLFLGRLGAEYLLSLGHFNSFGFVSGVEASDNPPTLRECGFRQALEAKGQSCSSPARFEAPPEVTGQDRLAHWLKSLAKPAAIMCFYDPPAVEVLNACRKLNLDVPNQVAVLGIDNDEPICETATPPLSSLQPDHETMGYLAAQQLDALLNGRKHARRKIALAHQIIERETTRRISPSALLVSRAKAFIAENAARGITVQDVAVALGVSRRLADLRFREIENDTIRSAIERRRLEIAVEKLKSTPWSITRIATASGYASPQAFRAAFKKRFRCDPRSVRKPRSRSADGDSRCAG